MNGQPRYLRRSLPLSLAAIALITLATYVLHPWFHDDVLAALKIEHRAGHTLGTLAILCSFYGLQYFLYSVFYRRLSIRRAQEEAERQAQADLCQAARQQVAQEIGEIPTFQRIVTGHLKSVAEQTESAACTITGSLQAIDAVVTRLNDFVRSTSERSEALATDSEDRIAQNQVLIQQLNAFIAQRIDETQQDQQRLSDAVQEARSLQELVQLIKHIAGQTNLLALNAAIEAARAGEAGRGFAVVADEVRKLSQETEAAVSKINHGISSVAGTIESQFRDKTQNCHIDEERQGLEQFAQQLAQLGASYAELMRHERETLTTVNASADELARMFMDAVASVQFQDVTRQQIEHVNAALECLAEHSRRLGRRLTELEHDEAPLAHLTEEIEQLFSRYVMEGQRETHARAIGSGRGGVTTAPPRRSNVELF